MNNEDMDIVRLLEKRQKYHADQLQRVNIALAALKGQTGVTDDIIGKATEPTQWTANIMAIFDESNNALTLPDVRNKLAEKGISEALNERTRGTISNTLMRLVKNKKLEKAGYGLYRKKKSKAQEALGLLKEVST